MHFKHTRICIFLIFIFTSFTISAEHPSFEPLFSIKEAFNTEQAPLVYSEDEVFELGLRFSECLPGSEAWKRCISAFETIKKEVTSQEMQTLSEEDRGRAILKYLYRDYLKKYDLNQTKLDIAIETGNYNCVSSAVLYMAAAKAAGLQVYGQSTTQHAFCSIYLSSQKENQSAKAIKIDVETTNPYGFNPGSKEEIENQNQIKKYYVVPKKYYSNRVQVSDGVFTGLIAGNLCSDYIRKNNYFKALPLGAARYNIIQNQKNNTSASVRNQFDILPCNYINQMTESAAEYASRLEWFTDFIERWGSNDFVQKNMDSCFNNLFVLCIKEKNYPLAQTYYKSLSFYVSEKQLNKSLEILADIYILSETDGLSSRNQINKIMEIKESENFTESQQKRADLYLETAWLDILNSYMKKREYNSGYSEALEAQTILPQSSSINKMKQAFYSNIIAQIHNDFAREANQKHFEEALEILNKGLTDFPDDKTLVRDLTELKKIIER